MRERVGDFCLRMTRSGERSGEEKQPGGRGTLEEAVAVAQVWSARCCAAVLQFFVRASSSSLCTCLCPALCPRRLAPEPCISAAPSPLGFSRVWSKGSVTGDWRPGGEKG